VLRAVVFSGGQFLTPSSTAEELPAAMPLHTLDRELSACTARASAICSAVNSKSSGSKEDSFRIHTKGMQNICAASALEYSDGRSVSMLLNAKQSAGSVVSAVLHPEKASGMLVAGTGTA
jgi:hypothetical protein